MKLVSKVLKASTERERELHQKCKYWDFFGTLEERLSQEISRREVWKLPLEEKLQKLSFVYCLWKFVQSQFLRGIVAIDRQQGWFKQWLVKSYFQWGSVLFRWNSSDVCKVIPNWVALVLLRRAQSLCTIVDLSHWIHYCCGLPDQENLINALLCSWTWFIELLLYPKVGNLKICR